jgi:outer membrane protein OmpA-like peptidoglycan-associated protein
LNKAVKIEISGHTDNVGTDQANQVLSENRAKAVYQYLIANGIDAGRLSYKGYGETQPIATNDMDEGRGKNRRTEFKIIAK